MAKRPARVIPIDKPKRPPRRAHPTEPDAVLLRLRWAVLRGEDVRPALLDAMRAGAIATTEPDDLRWLAEVFDPPKRGPGRPSKRETVSGWSEAIDALRSQKIAERVEHWRALIARDRGEAEQQLREVANQQGREPDRGLLDRRRDLRAGAPFDFAAKIVAWELRRPASPPAS